MLSLVLRRALAQRRLVASVVALVTVGATLLGVCALLLGPTQDRAFAREVQRSQPQDVSVDAYLVDLSAADLADVRESATEQLETVLGPLDPTVTAVATSRMRDREDAAGGLAGLGYLAAGDGAEPRSVLVSGRWPAPVTGEPETALPEAAAGRLGLAIGDRVTLGRATGLGGGVESLTLVVVGTYRPASPVGWESDPLAGAGFEADYSDGSKSEAAYGPFVLDDDAFLASGSPVAGLRVTARPDLAKADRETVGAAAAALDGANGLLAERVGDRVRITRVASSLPATLERIEAQEAAGRSTVLVAVLLGGLLSLAALLLAGRLVAAVRDEERVLLVALGTSPRQQFVGAAVEGAVLAAVAALVALPAAALLHSALTHGAGPTAAGLAQSPAVTAGLLLAVLGSAAVLVPVLVVTALDTGTTSAATRRRWALARAGADVVLVAAALAVAALGWWQLRSQPATTAVRGDVTLTLVPVVCLTAVTVVVVRLVPALLRAGGWVALRSRTLVLPLSVQQAARRPHTGTAMVLVAAAVAAATFGVGLRSTWERSQVDQAALGIGTDLSLTLPSGASTTDLQAVAAVAADGGASSAVLDRPLALGRFVGPTGAPPVLVALDSREAGALLRGRLDGDTTWDDVASELTPGAAVAGLPLEEGATLRGRVRSPLPVTVTPTVVVEDATGLRHPLTASPLELDGRPHPLVWSEPLDGSLRVLALSLRLDAPPSDDEADASEARVTIALRLPAPDAGSEPAADDDWQVQRKRNTPVSGEEVTVTPLADATQLRVGAGIVPGYLSYGGADLLATSFAAPDGVPVVVSEELADVVGTKVGGELAGVVGDTSITLRVVGVVGAVPSAPGQLAVLADTDAISRSLIASGTFDPAVDAWWFADQGAATVRELRALGVGEVTTRAGVTAALARGPLQVTVPTVLITLAAAAVVLLLAGVALVTGADRRRRSAEITRLRALGLPRRSARRLLIAEHAAFLTPLLALGALVGAGASLLLAPLMVRSDLGAAPVPAAAADWPWGVELLLLGTVVLGSALVTWVVTVLQVRGSDTAGLRMGDDS